MLASAQAAVRRCGLPQDWALDLAQQAMAEVPEKGLEEPGDAEIEGTVRRLAQRERQRCRREAQDAQRRTVPPLLPRLAGLATFASDAGRFRRILRGAMGLVATDPGVLKDRQLRLFELADVERSSPAACSSDIRTRAVNPSGVGLEGGVDIRHGEGFSSVRCHAHGL